MHVCFYSVSAPPRIKLTECHSDSVGFSLEKPSCAESRGYITGYDVSYCQLNDDGECVGGCHCYHLETITLCWK